MCRAQRCVLKSNIFSHDGEWFRKCVVPDLCLCAKIVSKICIYGMAQIQIFEIFAVVTIM
jgi:hypothetical protein